MTLLLISGRPGAGKTEFCRWLRDTYNFIHVDTDTRPQILYSLVVQTAIEAQATKEYMLGLGSDCRRLPTGRVRMTCHGRGEEDGTTASGVSCPVGGFVLPFGGISR